MPDTLPAILQFFAAAWLVLFLPGAAWLAWGRPARLDPLEWAAEAAGLSLALTCVAGGFAFYGGILPGQVGFLGLYSLAFLAWLVPGLRARRLTGFSAGGLLALAALLVLAAWRLYQARSLSLPAWVDSVHHTLLVRLIGESGGLPQDWLPYLPVPFYYHFGFQLAAACFKAWAGLELSQAVLVFGQLVNALVAVSVYRLGKTLWADVRKAGLAAVLVGFVFTMPAYYLTWGRYTLLAGLVLLPLAISALLELRRQPDSGWTWARLILYTTGIFFCHYLAAALFGLFVALLGLAELARWLASRLTIRPAWQPLAGTAAGTLLALPWLLRVWDYSRRYAALTLADPFDPARQEALRGAWDYTFYLLGPVRSLILLGFAGLGAVWVLWRGGGRLLAAWALLLAFLSAPVAPRFAPFRQDHFAIILFLPAALLLGRLIPDLLDGLLGRWLPAGAGWVVRHVPTYPPAPSLDFAWKNRGKGSLDSPSLLGRGPGGRSWWKDIPNAALVLLIASLLTWGLLETRDILNAATIFTTPDDVAALKWIETGTPPEARFFINGALWQGNTYRGLDGGYWITSLTGRYAAIPSAAVNQGSAQFTQEYAAWGEQVSKVAACDALFWNVVEGLQLDYAYLRAGTGSLQAKALSDCPGVVQVFQQGVVSIFKLTAPPQ